MKEPVVLALACSATAGSTFAQTSWVTMYGIADASGRQVKNDSAGTVKGVTSGSHTVSRLGAFAALNNSARRLTRRFVYGSSAALGNGAATAERIDNGVSYFLPKTLGGWFGQMHVAAGEGLAGNKYTGGRIGFENSTSC